MLISFTFKSQLSPGDLDCCSKCLWDHFSFIFSKLISLDGFSKFCSWNATTVEKLITVPLTPVLTKDPLIGLHRVLRNFAMLYLKVLQIYKHVMKYIKIQLLQNDLSPVSSNFLSVYSPFSFSCGSLEHIIFAIKIHNAILKYVELHRIRI